jgi:transcriptional regulator with XRE-family HTH domain
MTLHKDLKAKRKACGLTQVQMAEMLAYSPAYYARIEQGRERISQAFHNRAINVMLKYLQKTKGILQDG